MIVTKEYLMETIVGQLKSNKLNRRYKESMVILNSIDLNNFKSIKQLVDYLDKHKLFTYDVYKCKFCNKLSYEFMLVTSVGNICSECLDVVMKTFLESMEEKS